MRALRRISEGAMTAGLLALTLSLTTLIRERDGAVIFLLAGVILLPAGAFGFWLSRRSPEARALDRHHDVTEPRRGWARAWIPGMFAAYSAAGLVVALVTPDRSPLVIGLIVLCALILVASLVAIVRIARTSADDGRS